MTVLSVTRAELKSLDALTTVEGQAALVLAKNLDSGRNGMAKQGDAARLLGVMSELRNRSVKGADAVDEVRRAREAKQRAAAG